jgi:HEAT repeat protein
VSARIFLRQHRATLLVVGLVAGAATITLARMTRAPDAPVLSVTSPGSAPAPHGEHAADPVPTALGPRVHTTSALVGDAGIAKLDRVAELRRGLASDDEATRIAAVEAAVSATAIETLDDLEKFELARDPEAAPTVIHGVALLGASAEGKKRDEAAGTLARWLRDERRREGPDAVGNVSNLVEALGDVGGREAVDALTAALDRGDLALHVETLAVMKLGELGDARARASVERFARRASALPPAEGIDEELRVEAIAAARTTLTKI